MTYCPPDGWNQRILSPYWPSLPPLQNEARANLQDALAKGDIALESPALCYCGGREFTLICDRDRFGLDFKAKLCRRCGLVLTDPRLAEKDMPLYYSRYYHPIVFGRLPSRGFLFAANQGRLVFERMWRHDSAKIKNQALVLEIGAGLGDVLKGFGESAREKGVHLRLMGTEYSPDCLAAIRGLGIEAVEGGCPEVLAVSSEPFDIIILSHVLEHVTDLAAFMAGLKRLTSPETLLYVEVPGILTLHAKPEYDLDFRKYFIHAHSVHYNLNTLKYHMDRFGWSCKAGNEIAYGIFQPTNEAPSLSSVAGMADHLLFYLTNLERLRAAEAVAARHKSGQANKTMLFGYSPLEVDTDQFRIATCNDLIWLKARHRSFLLQDATDYSKRHLGLGWGLKALGYYYVFEYLSRLRPARVLEIGAGLQTFFSERCHELGLEYWMCDDGHFYSDEVIQKHANQAGTTFVQGQVGQYLDALPADYFDLVLSVSVAEHVPQANLNAFYGDIMRMIKKPSTADGQGGRMIHTVDIPYLPGFEVGLRHLRAGRQAGFTIPSETHFLQFRDVPLFEPLEIQYIYYPGKDRDMWGNEMTTITHRTATVIFNASVPEPPAMPEKGR